MSPPKSKKATNCPINRQRERRKERETQIDKSMEARVRETQKIVN